MFFLSLASLLSVSCVSAQFHSDLSLDAYTRAQTEAALRGISANTYAAGSDYAGLIIASPATDTARAGETGGQDYYYSWTRDAALTMKTVINQYASGDSELEDFIKAYIENERKHQHLDTLSGNFTTGGLGEPKYYVNSTAFNGSWGRPQRDGPALRSIAIIGFLGLQNDTAYVKNITETVVKPDLDYVAANWQSLGFDLWEEQDNLHFFTAMVQARALRGGAKFLSAITGNESAAVYYMQEEAKIGLLIDSFWNSAGTGTFDSHLNMTASGKPTGVDCANLLASIHGSDANATYRPSSSKILASAATMIDEFTGLYPIDVNNTKGVVSIGRYPSDVYDGIQTSKGNPWFLCTSAMAETLYLAATEFTQNGTIAIDDTNSHFFRKIIPSATSGSVYAGANTTGLISSMRAYADSFLALEQKYVGQNYSMAEEFNRTTGAQQGARDLTWSYAAYVSAARARAGQVTYDFAHGNPSNVLAGNQLDISAVNTSALSSTNQALATNTTSTLQSTGHVASMLSRLSLGISIISVLACSLY